MPIARPVQPAGCASEMGRLSISGRKGRRSGAALQQERGRIPDRLPAMVGAFKSIPTRSAVLDGELCLMPADGLPSFYGMREMRTRWPDETSSAFFAFDLLHQDGVDLRHLPLSERKRDLDRLCGRSKVPVMRMIQHFPMVPFCMSTAPTMALKASCRTLRPLY